MLNDFVDHVFLPENFYLSHSLKFLPGYLGLCIDNITRFYGFTGHMS